MQKIKKENKIMSEKLKQTHKNYCDYEIAKAKASSRIYSVRVEPKKQTGIRTSGLSKAMLAQQLAALY